jgi:hypothetical protein
MLQRDVPRPERRLAEDMTSTTLRDIAPHPAPIPGLPGPRLAAACLVASAVLSVASVALQPPFPQGDAALLEALAAAGARAWASALLFASAQLPLALAVVAVGASARPRAARTAVAGAVLAVVGAFGHAVYSGVSLMTLVLAGGEGDRAAHVRDLERASSSPLMVFALLGLAGTVLGLTLLAIALWRSRSAPRWVPVLVVAFLVVEFIGTSLSTYVGYVSSALLLLAFVELARVQLRGKRPQVDVSR